MNRYPLWKYVVVVVALVLGALYALPNVYGDDPAVQITTTAGEAPPAPDVQQALLSALDDAGIEYKAAEVVDNRYQIRFPSIDEQFRARDTLAEENVLPEGYRIAMNLAPAAPEWLRSLGATPMSYGLDLRGGVHLLLAVDLDSAVDKSMERHRDEFRTLLREERIFYQSIETEGQGLALSFREAPAREQALRELRDQYRDLVFEQDERDGLFWVTAGMSEAQLKALEDDAVQQNLAVLRRRVEELNIAEPIIQRQGRDRIVVELPGLQDPTQAKELLGKTATLEFRLVQDSPDPYRASADAPAPPGTRLFSVRSPDSYQQPYILLKNEVMLTGDYITDASSGIDQQGSGPEVNVTLNSAGGQLLTRVTRDNVGKPMATVFIETEVSTMEKDGKQVTETSVTEEVINVATIQAVLGSRFRITGLDSPQEARELALLLKAGALAAPVWIVEERTIGPGLGQDNITQGLEAIVLGFLLVVVFMVVYYKVFGLIADLALLANLVLIVALLSVLPFATLTLPGIAGIVLTVGMAVDANVLIFERIREELADGKSVQKAIEEGYGKAFSTIADANITTFIAAFVLLAFGTGPIRGFAVTLTVGIATSMFTAIVGTRAVVNALYGGKRLKKLPI